MWVALGLVTVPTNSAAVRLVDRLSAAQLALLQSSAASIAQGNPVPVHGFLLSAWKGNTDEIYIGDSSTMTKAGVRVAQVIGPAGGTNGLSYSVADTKAPNAVALDAVHLMADVASEGILVSVLVT